MAFAERFEFKEGKIELGQDSAPEFDELTETIALAKALQKATGNIAMAKLKFPSDSEVISNCEFYLLSGYLRNIGKLLSDIDKCNAVSCTNDEVEIAKRTVGSMLKHLVSKLDSCEIQ